jgi:hypothetical protein
MSPKSSAFLLVGTGLVVVLIFLAFMVFDAQGSPVPPPLHGLDRAESFYKAAAAQAAVAAIPVHPHAVMAIPTPMPTLKRAYPMHWKPVRRVSTCLRLGNYTTLFCWTHTVRTGSVH